MSKSIRCMLGLHKWLVLKTTTSSSIRCEVRDEVRGNRGPRTMSMDFVEDRICQRCGKVDAQIEKMRDSIRLEEDFIWQTLRGQQE